MTCKQYLLCSSRSAKTDFQLQLCLCVSAVESDITHQALSIVTQAKPIAVFSPSPTDLTKCHYKSHSS